MNNEASSLASSARRTVPDRAEGFATPLYAGVLRFARSFLPG